MSTNMAIISGNLGADPEIRSFQNGGRVANMRVATSKSWNDAATGERKELTEWHSVAVMTGKNGARDGLIGRIERVFKKGDTVTIVGEIRTRKWQDENGQNRYSTEIVVDGFNGSVEGPFQYARSDSANQDNGNQSQQNRQNGNNNSGAVDGNFANGNRANGSMNGGGNNNYNNGGNNGGSGAAFHNGGNDPFSDDMGNIPF